MSFILSFSDFMSQYGTIIILVVLLAVLLIFSYMRNKKEGQNRANILDSIKKGTKVITMSGIYGTVVSIEDTIDGKIVLISSGDGEHISYMRMHINAIGAIDSKNQQKETVENNVSEKVEEIVASVKEPEKTPVAKKPTTKKSTQKKK